jgi:uncharacterized RDD family membrane protein YckC
MAVTSASANRQQRALPRQVRIEYASLEARVTAASLDILVGLIVAALLILAGSIIILISSDFERVDPSETSINIFWGCAGAILPAWIFYLFVALCWKGQTIGQSVMQIMVIRSDGKPLGLFGSVARVIGLMVYAVFIGAGAIAAYAFKDSAAISGVAVAVACLFVAAGVLWGAFDRHRRTLHDRIAGTIVVKVS